MHYDPNDLAGYQDRLTEVINALVADPEKAEHDGNAGRQRASGNSPERIAEQILEIYPKACA
jgi:glycosyltransferase involved in cell wall biosynthesis